MTWRDIDVVAAGHICVDIIPSFLEAEGAGPGEILRPGKLLIVGRPSVNTGGAVSNTGHALRRLGLRVSLMGKCGDDPFGDLLIDLVRREAPGAEAGMTVSPGEQTSYTIVLSPPGIDRMFMHCPSTNDTFGPEDVDLDVLRGARLFHFGYPSLMARMYGSGGAELAQIMRGAAEAGAFTSLDMALPDPASPAGRADWRAILRAALPHTNVFLPSVEEIMFMLRRERFEELARAPGGVLGGLTAADLRALADECLEMGVGAMVIKCGHLGAYLKVTESTERIEGLVGTSRDWVGVEIFEPACQADDVLSAVGAGDCAVAGFLCAMLKGEGPAWCMAALTVVGAQNLAAFDAFSGVQTWDETIAQVQSDPPKVPLPPALREFAR
ncbi:MAG: PfkB family carbohydrate kinase [Candidatus Brocadiia bacterium]|nr:PfkB family carbohydrate kinase [Candidatus Brocadiia bacterium]